MKKSLLILAMALVGCEKEDIMDCNCGVIQDDGIDSSYWITIKNDCTNNTERFNLTEGDWMNAHQGVSIV